MRVPPARTPALALCLLLAGCEAPAPAGDGPAGPDGGAGPESDGALLEPDAQPPGADLAPPARCSGKPAPQPGTSTRMIMSGGVARSYLLHVPRKYDPAKPTALVFGFHGFTSNARDHVAYTQLEPASEARGFLMVAPQGTGILPGWNAGTCCVDQRVDDVGLVRDILGALRRDFCVDDARVFASGFSNGGFFSHRLGCELSDEIAAIAPVSGGLLFTPCEPKRAVSVLYVHGTKDSVVPYEGGGPIGNPKAEDTFKGWATRDGCPGEPKETDNKGQARCRSYSGCRAGTEVALCTITDGTHSWPGGAGGSMDLDATSYLLDFFDRHGR